MTHMSKSRRAAARVVLVVALGLMPTIARGQSVDVMLMGTVADVKGAALPGATVTATADSIGVARSSTADQAGHYMFLNLPAGIYTVRAELSGFAPSLRDLQVLYVGTTVTVDFGLDVAGVAENVTVRGALPALETTKSTLTRIVQRDEIDALPLIDRNFNDLAALAPGVTKTGVYRGVDISGSRDFQNGYQLDGVSAERQHLGDQRTTYAQDWIQEFQVVTSQANAEFGQAAGGVLNAITRSGGNRLSARMYGFFRNDAWDAMPAFAVRKPPLDESRIGATVGGPVVRDRVFYFGGVERLVTESSSIVNSTFASANGTFPSTDRQILSLAKIEAFVNPAHTLRLRYNAQRLQRTGASIGGTGTEEHGRFGDLRSDDVVGAWTWVVSPVVLNEARMAWNRNLPADGCNFAAENPPGTWFERLYPGAQFGCPVNFGTIAEDQVQVIDNLFWSRGKHDMKFGVQTYWTRSSGDFRNVRDGRYSFERDVPFSLSDPNSHPFSFIMIQGPTAWSVPSWSGGVFGQDTWRINDDVALSLGVRYDLDGSLTALNRYVRLDRGMHTIAADTDNIAPRIGIAWTPLRNNKRTLFRGGAGVYYDQNHNNLVTTVLLNNILVDQIVTLNANNALLNPFWPDIARAKTVLADALARNTIPDLSLLGNVPGSTNDVDADLEVPATTQISGGVAHEFHRWLNASADVVYVRGVDQYVLRNTNLDPNTFQRINPNYTAITSFGNGGTSRYRALHMKAAIVPSTGHLLKLAYTLATNRSDTATTLSAGTTTNPFDLAEDEGPTDSDVRHNVTVNGWSTLPLGLQVSGILSYRSALPYSATTNAPRPDGKPFAYRPEPRNARRGDSALSLDVRLAMTVTRSTRHSATAFVEIFNLTNQLNYSSYIGTVTSSRFGEPTAADPKRRIQIGFRVEF